MLLSIIMPLYNMEHSIERAMNALDIGCYPNIELVVVNDCCTDRTMSLLEKYRGYQNIVFYDFDKHVSTGEARNKGVSLASGDYICFLDGDDLLNVINVRYVCGMMFINGYDMVAGLFDTINSNGDIVSTKGVWDKKLAIDTINHFSKLSMIHSFFNRVSAGVASKVYKRSFLLENNITFSDTCYAEDMAFTYKALSCVDESKLGYSIMSLYTYTVYKTNVRSNCRDFDWRELFIAWQDVFAFMQDRGYYDARYLNALYSMNLHMKFAYERIKECDKLDFAKTGLELAMRFSKDYEDIHRS